MLGQLGARVQHALRAFTPNDAKDLRATVGTYPRSKHYELEVLLTSMGIGEAAVTILSESGVPTPVAHARLVAPASRMAPADDVDGTARRSLLWTKYGTRVDPQSARELLAGRLAQLEPEPEPEPEREPELKPGARPRPSERRPAPRRRTPAPAGGTAEAVGDFLRSREGQRLQKKAMRGLRLAAQVAVSSPVPRLEHVELYVAGSAQ